MKNLKYLLFIMIFGIFMISDCFAFSREYKYNYEVTSVTFDGQNGTLSGWAILNAGVDDGTNDIKKTGSPALNRKLESTTKDPYSYSLRVYGININGDTSREVRYIKATALSVEQTSLTNTLCWKYGDDTCAYFISSNYDNVGYQFKFDFSNFLNPSKYVNASYPNLSINGYKFVLTVKSTKPECSDTDLECSQTFPLVFLEKAVFGGASDYFDSNTYMGKVDFIANDASTRLTTPCGVSPLSKVTTIETAGGSYEIATDTNKNPITESCNGLTYYKIKDQGKEGWVPATFVAPPQSDYTVMINDVCNVDGNALKFKGVENQTTTNSCQTIVNLKDNVSESCVTQSKTKYYTFTCEDIIQTEFIPSKKKYYRGDDFKLDVKVTSYVRCTGSFESALWENDYDRGNAAVRSSLTSIKGNFFYFKMNDYTSNPTGSIRYEISSGKYSTMPLVVKSNNVVASGKIEQKLTENGRQTPVSLTFETSKREVVMSLEQPIVVNNEKASTPYQVTVTNLGYSKNSKAYFDCKIDKILALYRSIDPSNPFISASRAVGENWRNDTYDFVNIIDEEIWDSNNTPKYVFMVTQDNIKAIKKNNNLLGMGAYIGNDCVLSSGTKKYYCNFLRNQNYFTNVYINGTLQ